jgi:hypothetical protein
LPVQGPLSHGVSSAGRLFPQPSRGRLLTWFVMHTTERVRTPAPHSAEHCETGGGHVRGDIPKDVRGDGTPHCLTDSRNV